ncbi:hypothetical protein RJ640_011271 [Escallonia rubra]|uniref:Uncharacterized protein n=1 Tax=Escallonia rubra TaxID=112253 RepID=A0AA88REK9_9ASTE|nr:hypothetical protein RJ640_011271 [Escallonia rubra]
MSPPPRIKDLLLLTSTLSTLYLLLLHHRHPISATPTTTTTATPTTLRHLLFSIASTSSSLPKRTPFINLWYSPTSTRAFLFLDRVTPNLTTTTTLPPIMTSSSTSFFPYTFQNGRRSAIRVARVVKEAVQLNQSDIRWYVFGDDDTVFFSDNLVKTLSKYDHERWYYVGSNSESYEQNVQHSFDMAFGGGGFAISSSLARVLAGVLDSCLVRYPHLYGSDARVFSCLAELGVGLTHEPGFHQVDVRGDLFGMLSSHPLSPLLSLHHLDIVESIFPGMSRTQALEHLFKAVDVDPARILQQSVCYDRSNSRTVSVAWGYAIQVFEGNQLLPDFLLPQRTFRPWKRGRDVCLSRYMFKTREYPNVLCTRPPAFFLKSILHDANGVYTDYTRYTSGDCLEKKAILKLEHIKVFSRKLDLDIGQLKAPRRQCCDVVSSSNETMAINIRECRVDELISMQN